MNFLYKKSPIYIWIALVVYEPVKNHLVQSPAGDIHLFPTHDQLESVVFHYLSLTCHGVRYKTT